MLAVVNMYKVFSLRPRQGNPLADTSHLQTSMFYDGIPQLKDCKGSKIQPGCFTHGLPLMCGLRQRCIFLRRSPQVSVLCLQSFTTLHTTWTSLDLPIASKVYFLAAISPGFPRTVFTTLYNPFTPAATVWLEQELAVKTQRWLFFCRSGDLIKRQAWEMEPQRRNLFTQVQRHQNKSCVFFTFSWSAYIL